MDLLLDVHPLHQLDVSLQVAWPVPRAASAGRFGLQNPAKQCYIIVQDMSEMRGFTHCKHHPSFLYRLFQPGFLFIAANALNVIPPIRMVGLVMGNVQFAHY